MDLDLSKEELLEALNKIEPDMIMVNRDEIYSEDNQSYRFLYEQLLAENNELQNKVTELLLDLQNSDRKSIEQQNHISSLENELSCLEKSIDKITQELNGFLSEEIYVVNVSTYDEINSEAVSDESCVDSTQNHKINIDSLKKTISAENPAVYEGKRPGWFILLKTELNAPNMQSKNISNTSSVLKDRLMFWKNHKNDSAAEAANEYDKTRYKRIIELLDDKCSNEEKYLKYMLLSPGISKDFIATLEGASKLNLNANLIIALLEQSNDIFNKDVIELYVSQVRKSNEYNLKQELAEELVAGKWCITSEVNNEKKTFQLVPIADLKNFEQKLELIIDTFSSFQAPQNICVDSTQKNISDTISFSDSDLDYSEIQDGNADDDEGDNETVVPVSDEFDDTYLNDSIVFNDSELNSK
jgi:hypothetical protein